MYIAADISMYVAFKYKGFFLGFTWLGKGKLLKYDIKHLFCTYCDTNFKMSAY